MIVFYDNLIACLLFFYVIIYGEYMFLALKVKKLVKIL